MEDVPLKQAVNLKYLGITLDSKLYFTEHIKNCDRVICVIFLFFFLHKTIIKQKIFTSKTVKQYIITNSFVVLDRKFKQCFQHSGWFLKPSNISSEMTK